MACIRHHNQASFCAAFAGKKAQAAQAREEKHISTRILSKWFTHHNKSYEYWVQLPVICCTTSKIDTCPAKIPLENCIGRVISHADGAMKKSRIKQRPYSSNASTSLTNKAAMNVTKSHGKSHMPSRLVEKMHPEQFQVLGHNHEALGATLSMHWTPAAAKL